jgi:metal-sulfur cluster biosynthetic enzyme
MSEEANVPTTPAAATVSPSNAAGPMPTPEKVYEVLQSVEDPEIHQNIVGLGLIYGVDINEPERKVGVKMTLTTPYCPYGPQLIQETKMCILALPGVKDAEIDIVWEPVWDPKTMASDEVKDALGLW